MYGYTVQLDDADDSYCTSMSIPTLYGKLVLTLLLLYNQSSV